MSYWENQAGQSDEWYTPRSVFEALGVSFDLDVAAPVGGAPHVPARTYISEDSLNKPWADVSLFSLHGDILRPWKNSALVASKPFLPTPFILASGEIARAGLPLTVGNVWGNIASRESDPAHLSGARDASQIAQPSNAAAVNANSPVIEKTSHLKPVLQMDLRPDAENVTGRLLGRGCADFGQINLNWFDQSTANIGDQSVDERRSDREVGSITLLGASALLDFLSTGPQPNGCMCAKCLRDVAHIAAKLENYTRIISSHFPILNVPELFGATSSLPASVAISVRASGIHVPGLGAILHSLGYSSDLNCIGMVSRPFVWANPPFGGRGAIKPWLDKFIAHGNGIALTPDRTSAPWFQEASRKMEAVLFTRKIRFLRPDGTEGKSPSNGTALMAIGIAGTAALSRAAHRGFGTLFLPA